MGNVEEIQNFPTYHQDLSILQWEEVLCDGFDLTVLDPSDRKGTDTYCIVAIEDKKMGFISYCMSLSLYIMSSCLKRYSVLMNLILQMHAG